MNETVNAKQLEIADNLASNVVMLYAKLGVLCTVVREGVEQPRIFAAQTYLRKSAELLYQAADVLAVYAMPSKN